MADREYRFESNIAGGDLEPETIGDRELDEFGGDKLRPKSTPGDALRDGDVDARLKITPGTVTSDVVGDGNLRVQNMDQVQLARFIAFVVDTEYIYKALKQIIRGIDPDL